LSILLASKVSLSPVFPEIQLVSTTKSPKSTVPDPPVEPPGGIVVNYNNKKS